MYQREAVIVDCILLLPKAFVFFLGHTDHSVVIVAFRWYLIGQLHPEQEILLLVEVIERYVDAQKPAEDDQSNVCLSWERSLLVLRFVGEIH